MLSMVQVVRREPLRSMVRLLPSTNAAGDVPALKLYSERSSRSRAFQCGGDGLSERSGQAVPCEGELRGVGHGRRSGAGGVWNCTSV